MKKMFSLNRKHYIIASIIFSAAGLIGGYVYYITVGCTSNGCAITSNVYITALWGGLLGYLMSGIIFSQKKSKEE